MDWKLSNRLIIGSDLLLPKYAEFEPMNHTPNIYYMQWFSYLGSPQINNSYINYQLNNLLYTYDNFGLIVHAMHMPNLVFINIRY